LASVESETLDYGMLPVENAVAGSVAQSYELLMEHDLRIYAEVIVRFLHSKRGRQATRGKLHTLRKDRACVTSGPACAVESYSTGVPDVAL